MLKGKEALDTAPTYKAMTASVSVEPLGGGKVSVRMVFPERTIMLTLGAEEAMDLATQLLAAAVGRLAV
jgi:hypothetical protein